MKKKKKACRRCAYPMLKDEHTCEDEEPEENEVINLSDRKEKIEKEELQLPEIIIKKLKHLYEMALVGKVESLILNYEYILTDEELEDPNVDDVGATLFFNQASNLREIIGDIEIMKRTAMDLLFYGEDMEEQGE